MHNVEIDKIIIGENRRPIGDITNLVESIRMSELLNPITITKDNTLIAGRHRLEACKKLGWAKIPAIIIDLSPELAELAEISENLVRNELTALERAEQIVRRKVLHDQINSERTTRSSIARGPSTSTCSASTSFIEDTAVTYDCSTRMIKQDIQIATSISKNIRDELRNTSLAKNKSELLSLARKPEEEQRRVVDLVKTGMVKNVSEANAIHRRQQIDSSYEEIDLVEGEDFFFTGSIQLGNYQDVIRMYPDASAELILTDPPFCVNKDSWDRDFDPTYMLSEFNRVLTDNGSALIFCNDVLLPVYLQNTCGLKLKQILHWHKSNRNPVPLDGPTGMGKYLQTIEYILWFTKSDIFTFNPRKINTDICGKTKSNLFITAQCGGGERFRGSDNKAFHPCQKPYGLIENLLLTHSNRGDLVVDPFLGTGTTAEAATRWERCFWGCEQDQEYHDLALKRAISVIGKYREDVDNLDSISEEYENIDDPSPIKITLFGYPIES